MRLDSQPLRISEDGVDTPNKINVKAPDFGKIEGEFTFTAGSASILRLAALHLDSTGCQNEPGPVTVRWAEKDSTTSVEFTQANDVTAAAQTDYLLTVVIDNSAGCDHLQLSFSIREVIDLLPPPTEGEVNDFSFQILIREFGDGQDTGALFLLQPKTDRPFTIQKVRGPQFLGQARVGHLDEAFLNLVFANSANSLSAERRSRLLDEFSGAGAIYVEGYSGRLCSDKLTELYAEVTLGETPVSAVFRFSAVPSDREDCHLSQGGLITAMIH